MSPKKFIQMGNMQTMIISMGEIIEKLFLKGFRVIKNKCIWRPHLVAKAVLEAEFGIINPLSKIRHQKCAARGAFGYKNSLLLPRNSFKSWNFLFENFYWGNIFSESFRLRTQA